jgi:hypothetical protein
MGLRCSGLAVFASTLAGLLVGSMGCSGGNGIVLHLAATPANGSMAGQYAVSFTGYHGDVGPLDATADTITLGGLRLVEVTVTTAADGSTTIAGTAQGSPMPGPADLSITTPAGTAVAPGLFTFAPPAPGVPLTWMAFGASLTMGIQSEGLTADTQRHGVSQLIATQAGVYLGLPLATDNLLPPHTVAEFNPDCSAMPGFGMLDLQGLIRNITDPQTGLVDLRRARLDPTLVPRDIAIGGETVSDILGGPTGAFGAIFENIVERPDATGACLLAAPPESQIDRVVAADPDVAFSVDLLANDLLPSVFGADDLHPEMITPVATLRPELDMVLARLGALHGQIFLANAPHLDLIPKVAVLRANLVPAKETACQFDQKMAAIDAMVDQYDADLATDAAPYANVHVVDLAGQVAALVSAPIVIGGQTFTPNHFGGLFSLDDLHFTNTGYALAAGWLLNAINATLNTSIPPPDLVAIAAVDPLSPSALKADGFTCPP